MIRLVAKIAPLIAMLSLKVYAQRSFTPIRTQMTFITGQSSSASPIQVRSISGAPYRLAFMPECSADDGNSEVDLVLYKADDTDRCEHNLLVPKGNWHGPQEYMFLAWDLVHGTSGSLFGPERVWDLPRLDIRLHIRIMKTDVTPGAVHTAENIPDDHLNAVTIQATTEPLPRISESKHHEPKQ